MSDILSFADELLQSMENVEGGNLAPVDVGISDSVKSDNDTIVDVASTRDLLDDCVSPSRYTNHRKSDVARQQLLVASVTANTSSFDFNRQLHKATTHDKNVQIPGKEDKYMQAARKRLARDKESKQMKEQDGALPFHPSSNQCNEESTLSKSANTENINVINDKNHNNLHRKDIGKLAYSCFEMFMKEVKEFQEKCKESSDDQNVKDFIVSLEMKYVKLSLNLLPDTNATVSKVKMLITRFIDKCKKDSSTDTIQKFIDALNPKGKHNKPTESKNRRNTWQCSLCLKKDLSVTMKKCITCGRSRGYRERDYAKDIRDPGPSREGKIFIEESAYVQKNPVCQNTSEEKKGRHYLYGKRDFEVDSRMQLKSDVSELLESIRDFTT